MSESFLRTPLDGGAPGPRTFEEKPFPNAETHRARVESVLATHTPRLFEKVADTLSETHYTGDEARD
ncbi:MAG: hypothetical protein RJA61_238 [Candidatus Parcubacteria bacterium]|jgi:hypothetical protein